MMSASFNQFQPATYLDAITVVMFHFTRTRIISTHFNTRAMFQLGNAFLKVVSRDNPQEITLALFRRRSSSKHNTEMVFNASADADLRRLKEEIWREKEKIQRPEEENRKKELRLAREMEERARRQRDRRM